MKRSNIPAVLLMCAFLLPIGVLAQWANVLQDVKPVDIAISPDYKYDQTLYIVDDEQRLLISETGGSVWVELYKAADPGNPSQTILDVTVSPNFRNDNALVMLHKDGSGRLSFDRGQQWIILPVPDGTTGIVFSPKFAEDARMYCITGALGPVAFYESHNGGASWAKITDIELGSGFYSKLWSTPDTAATGVFAIQYQSKSLHLTHDRGETWRPAFESVVALRDFVFSPKYSQDSTMFVSDATEIWKNTDAGKLASWVNVESFSGTSGIQFAISPTFPQDQTLYAAVDRVGILVSTDGGEDYVDFSDGYLSTLPISLAISQAHPYTLFSGTQASGGGPADLWQYQTTSSVDGYDQIDDSKLRCNPNPISTVAEVSFELDREDIIQLDVFDGRGSKVMTLAEGRFERGMHIVGLHATDPALTAGVYLVRLQASGVDQSLKVVVR